MKKRAQQPDARTFTILFRGFAAHTNYPNSLGRALALYQSMSAENCPVKPSIIHTNAVLNVCARALDVDALLGVAAKLPTRGAGAPNSVSFTTILNAIRTAAWENRVGSFEEQVRSRQQATDQGRRIWADVVDRWRKGDIVIDEELVCAMGRLLLLGYRNQDCDDVLSLVEQTMGIPRQVPRVAKGNDTLQRKHQIQANAVPQSTSNDMAHQQPTALEPAVRDESEDEDAIVGTEFDPLDARKIRYASPGRNTLSMVVDACIHIRAFGAAQDYWGLLTDPEGQYNISPDGENYHMYLRLLRAKHASKLAVELLEEMRRGLVGGGQVLEPKTFRIALSACVRDIKNPNVLDNAGKMVRIMLDSLDKPDIKSLGMYLDVAMSPEHRDWKSLLGVLRGSAVSVRNLRSFLAYGDQNELKAWQRDNQEEMLKLVKRLVGAYDVAIDIGEGRMNAEETRFCKDQRGILSAWVYRMKRMSRWNPQWEDGKPKKEDEQDQEGKSDEGPRTDDATDAMQNDSSQDLDRLSSSFRQKRLAPEGEKRTAPDASSPGPFLRSNGRSSETQNDAQNHSGRDLDRQSNSFRHERLAPEGENRIVPAASGWKPRPFVGQQLESIVEMMQRDGPNDRTPEPRRNSFSSSTARLMACLPPKRVAPEGENRIVPDASRPKPKRFLGNNYRPSQIHDQRMKHKKRMTEGGMKKRVLRAQGILKDGLPTSW
jgi:hypothetical protein